MSEYNHDQWPTDGVIGPFKNEYEFLSVVLSAAANGFNSSH